MKQIILSMCLLFLFVSTKNNNEILCLDDVVKPYTSKLLYQVLYNECRGCSEVELLVVWNVIKNRIASPKWPSSLDSVLLEPHQFATHHYKPYTSQFKVRIDTIICQTKTYPYTYFVSFKHLKKTPSWIKRKKWYRKKGWQQHYSK